MICLNVMTTYSYSYNTAYLRGELRFLSTI
jgi:hypothetical protein